MSGPGARPRDGALGRALGIPLTVGWALALACSGCGGLLLAQKDAAILLLYLTCALGSPLFLLPTLALYLACFAPFALLAPVGRIRWAGLVASLGLAVAAGGIPSRISRAALARTRAAEDALAREPAGPVGVRTVELSRPSDWAEGGRDPETCDAVCRALVLGGGVDWVRAVNGGGPGARSALAIPGRGADCDGEPPGAADGPPRCVLYRPDGGEPAALVIRVAEERPAPAAEWLGPEPYGSTTIEATAAGEQVLLRRSSSYGVVFAPLVLAPAIRGMSSSGIAALRWADERPGVSLRQAVADLGLPLVEAPPPAPTRGPQPPTAEQTRRLVAALDTPGPLDADVDRWIVAARAWRGPDWTPDRLDLVRRLVRDPRVGGSLGVLTRDADVAAAVLPDLVAETEARGADAGPLEGAWGGLRDADEAALAPYADRLAAVLDRDGGLPPDRSRPPPGAPPTWGRSRALGPLAGRLGRDPSRWLVPLADAPDARIGAACRASDRWGPTLVPALRATPVAHPREAERVARALTRFGDGDWARAHLPLDARALRDLDRALERHAAPTAICP